MTIQTKAVEQYLYVVHDCTVVVLIMLCKAVLTFNSADEAQAGAIEVKTIEQHLQVILFVILHKMILTYNWRLKPSRVTK